ncbi:SdiA-regulated domain-containing protein [Shinella zoogloeoides]|uniref:Uncharacterized protein n=1 Tax=Shinella zoogloeoides TaxID=352475 RepID=A0A6N8TD40_SHIZO|nr:SdiA-regulated domain-containing protein [Shinella zoogloeoides]MXO01172.1 hypothetical protein [Shinella zoogloeoides]UEX84295.1 SdiA-regulated domain-containing protein [Shinella zoogloeoides]
MVSGLWASGLASLGVHMLAVCAVPQARQGGLSLPAFRVRIEALPIEGISADLSGLTYNAQSDTLFGVVNRPQAVVEISTEGRLLRRIALEGARDIEGITHVEGSRFVVVDEATHRISWFTIEPGTTRIDLGAAPFFTLDLGGFANMGVEGVSWDQKAGTLLLSQEMLPARVLAIDGLEETARGDGLQLAIRKCALDLPLGPSFADFSALSAHDATGNLLLLSHMTGAVAEFSPAGEPVGLMLLWAGRHGLKKSVPQAEGIAVGKDGDLYIVSEPNLFYRFSPQAARAW